MGWRPPVESLNGRGSLLSALLAEVVPKFDEGSEIGAHPLSRPSRAPVYLDVEVFGLGVGAMQT
jgi:hypothetical protein